MNFDPRRLWRRFLFWLRRDQIEAELREEMETHRAFREEALAHLGDDEAVRASQRALGNTLLAREDARGVWLSSWLESVLLDIRHGLRSLLRQRTFTATALVTIGVGSGALTAAFAVAHTVLLKPPDYGNADRLVQVLQVRDGRARSQVSMADVERLRTSQSLDNVTFAAIMSVSLTGAELPEFAKAVYTDHHLFPTLGTQPVLGRWPSAVEMNDDERPVVLSHRLWHRRYGGQTDVIGRPLDIDGRRYTIAAVMPEGFLFPAPYYIKGELWIPRPSTHPTYLEPERALILGFATLRPDVSSTVAQQEIDALGSADPAASLRLTEWAAGVRNGSRPMLLMLVATAAVVFLIVCINLFNLLLCRGVDRGAEMATRASLGAGRQRLVRHVVTETVVLFAAGGAVGILVAIWLARAVASLATFDIPRMDETQVDWMVAATSLALTCVAAIVVGLVPAWRTASGADARATTRSLTQHRQGRRVQRALIAAEISMAVLMVCGAGALAHHATRYSAADAGFDVEGLVQARVTPPESRYPDAATQIPLLREVITSLRAHPAIADAGLVDVIPGVAAGATSSVLLDQDPVPQQMNDLRSAAVRVVSAGYLEMLGLNPRSGRFLRESDGTGPPVALVNEAFVRTYLQDRAPLNSSVRITLDGLTQLDTTPRAIVGVVPDIREDEIFTPVPATVYIPMEQASSLRMAVVVRPAPGAGDLGRVIRERLAAVEPTMAVSGLVMPISDLMELGLARNFLSLRLVGGLALIAVLLAVVGVYGVTAHGVRHRAREIGIRLALGDNPTSVRRMVLAEGLRLLLVGAVVGAALAVWLLPLVRSFVVGADTIPIAGPIGVAAVLLTVAVMAGCDIPARRASRVDPASALRG
jgi:predicted permease